MEYLNKSFSVAPGAGVSQERWDAIFGRPCRNLCGDKTTNKNGWCNPCNAWMEETFAEEIAAERQRDKERAEIEREYLYEFKGYNGIPYHEHGWD